MNPYEAGPAAICWCDLETTGLDPITDVPLECAIVTTDWQFNIIDERQWLIDHTDLDERIDSVSPRVFDMHMVSGLWTALKGPPGPVPKIPLDRLDTDLCWAAEAFKGAKPLLGGFNPALARRFLEVYAPQFASRVHYANFDMSPNRRWVSAIYDSLSPDMGEPDHRAMGDVKAAIKFAKWFRAQVMTPHGRKQI